MENKSSNDSAEVARLKAEAGERMRLRPRPHTMCTSAKRARLQQAVHQAVACLLAGATPNVDIVLNHSTFNARRVYYEVDLPLR